MQIIIRELYAKYGIFLKTPKSQVFLGILDEIEHFRFFQLNFFWDLENVRYLCKLCVFP